MPFNIYQVFYKSKGQPRKKAVVVAESSEIAAAWAIGVHVPLSEYGDYQVKLLAEDCLVKNRRLLCRETM